MSNANLFLEENKEFKKLKDEIKALKDIDEDLRVVIPKTEYKIRTAKDIEDDKKRVKREIEAGKDPEKIRSGKTKLEFILTSNDIQKFSDHRLCTFTNLLIGNLPFCEEVVQLTDTTYTAKEGGGRLILRIGKTSKTFYPVSAKKRITGPTLGKFTTKDSNYYISQGKNIEADTKTARTRFEEYIEEVDSQVNQSAKGGNMTIREYLDSGKYKADREIYKIKNGRIKPVQPKTINMIKSGFEPFLDRKLSEVSEDWVVEFDEYSSKKRTNSANNVTIDGLVSESKRKLYTAFNAMFNICVKANYIKVNKIDGFASKFPRSKPNPQKYDIGYDELMDFIFDEDSPSSLAGKLIVAGMAVTAARNEELYANYIDNFDFENRSIFIPAEVSKNGEAGERTVYPDNDVFWSKLELHRKSIARNQKGHMFPSPVHPEQHISPSMYKEIWKAVKIRFNLKKNSRLYNLRHTLLTEIAKQHGIDVAAKTAGDSIETADKYYNVKDEERMREAFKTTTSSNKQSEQSNIEKSDTSNSSDEIVVANKVSMPSSIQTIFDMFLNGKVIPRPDHLYKSDWSKFVNLINAQKEAGMIEGSEIEMWLMMQ
ncbi:hypothetical protein BM527_04570 [Alteromonas sp. Mex14]|nr:hypothetical protein BM527_04570 [Alteromonas sp. Mex14]